MPFLITTSHAFPQNIAYNVFVDGMLDDLRESFSQLKQQSPAGIVNFAAELSKVASSSMTKYATEGKAGEWVTNTSDTDAGSVKTNHYGGFRESNGGTKLSTPLNTDRYPHVFTKLSSFYPDILQENSSIPIEVTDPTTGQVYISNIIIANITPQQNNGTYELLEGYGVEGSDILLHSDSGKLGELLYFFKHFDNDVPLATIDNLESFANYHIRNFIAMTEAGDLDTAINSMIDAHRYLTHACRFTRGGSTFPNAVLAVMADEVGIELPMMKLGEPLWFYASTLPADDYREQFRDGLNARREFIAGRSYNTPKTFFDETLSAEDVSTWQLNAVKVNKASEAPKTWVERACDGVRNSCVGSWLDRETQGRPSLVQRAVDAAKNSGWIR